MAGKREKPEDIVSKLRQVEVLQGQGATIADAVRQIGVTQQTYLSMAQALWRDAAVPARPAERAGEGEPAAATGGV